MVYTHRLLASSSWLILFCCCLWIDLVALVLGDGGDGRPLEVVGNSTITATLEQQEEQQRRQLINENTASSGVSSQEEEEQQQQLAKIHAEHLSLFSVCDSIATLGPTVFPKPTHIFEKDVDNNDDDDPNDEIVTYIQPSHGQHRPNQDAILLFAAEYSLQNYLVFLTTLQDTGYDGDVVMAISTMDWQKEDVQEYLTTSSMHIPHVIVYVVEYECYNAEGEAVESAKGGIRVCKQDFLFGRRSSRSGSTGDDDDDDDDDETIKALPDPRHARTVQNSRYELYWIWSDYYHAHSWIMLIDARDTIFQRNPFALVPRRRTIDSSSEKSSGILLLFGENVDATRLGQSAHNRDWLTKAYGRHVAEALAAKPTICSGSTMGEQVALEMYLRAMVMESDETQTVKMGADQGFHNRLYYSNKLANANAIERIIVQDQGYGIINNLGALRTKPLEQWGNGKLLDVERVTNGSSGGGGDVRDPDTVRNMTIRNWDGSVSPVVHQFDRHKELSNWYFRKKNREFKQRWSDWKKKSYPIA